MERFVFMKKRLDAIAAGRDVVDAVDGPAAHAAIENRFFSWCEAVDVDAERDLGRRPVGNLEARLAARIVREHEQQPAVERRSTRPRAKAHGEAKFLGETG